MDIEEDLSLSPEDKIEIMANTTNSLESEICVKMDTDNSDSKMECLNSKCSDLDQTNCATVFDNSERTDMESENPSDSSCSTAKTNMDFENPTSSHPSFYEDVKIKMLMHLSETDAHFKSQQRGEPDLTPEQKYDIAHDKLLKSPVNFLSQFGNYLLLDDLGYFKQFSGQYEIDFYVSEIKKQFDKPTCAKIVKNRRYSAMQKLIEGGEYFSEEEMKYRDPLLYEQMIGQYLTDDEIQSRVDKTDLKFSSILLKHIDQIEENKLYYYQKNIEECQTGETESDDNEEENEEESELESEEEGEEKKKAKITPEEQTQLKIEFYHIMQEKFLTGQDKHFFDYNTVDKNSDYDSLQTIEQDEQDKYFDDDDFD